MSDVRTKIIDLLEWWGLLAATVALLVKALQTVMTNRKSVKELKSDLERANRRIDDLEQELEENDKRTQEAINRIMEWVFKKQ
jgi:1,2-phenylacetyl-CoA epoxidase catalytic subunit